MLLVCFRVTLGCQGLKVAVPTVLSQSQCTSAKSPWTPVLIWGDRPYFYSFQSCYNDFTENFRNSSYTYVTEKATTPGGNYFM